MNHGIRKNNSRKTLTPIKAETLKKTSYILTLVLGLISCIVKTENTNGNAFIKVNPRQFKLTDTSTTFNHGDYYLSKSVRYFFSGEGDENSMDETPYLEEFSKSTLDSIADFMNRKSDIRVSIHFISDSEAAFDSCVPCNFEMTIKNYLVSKGINENRIICGFASKEAFLPIDSIGGFQLIIN